MSQITEEWYNVANLLSEFKLFLSSGNSKSRSTIKNYLSDVRHFFGWLNSYQGDTFLKSFPDDTFWTEHLEQYKQYLVDNGIPLKTLNRRLSSLRAFFSFCITQGWLLTNPTRNTHNVNRKRENLLDIKPETEEEQVDHDYDKRDHHGLIKSNETSSGAINYFFSRYLLFFGLVLLIISATLGMAGILYKNQKSSFAFALKPLSPTKTLSYQGRLTNKLGLPITNNTKMVFRLYNKPKTGKTLYNSGTCSIKPDADGFFSVLLGKNCGREIIQSVFTENPEVYIGIAIGGDQEMRPREQIPAVGFAANSEALQGFGLGTNSSSVPFINFDGELLISSQNPSIGATSQDSTFVVSSAGAITIQSAQEGDVTLSASQSGSLKFLAGGVEVGRVSNFGRFGIGTQTPDVKLEVQDSLEQFRITYGPNEYTSLKTNSTGDFMLSPTGEDTLLPGRLLVGASTSSTNGNTLEVSGTAHLRGALGRTGLFVTADSKVGIGTTSPVATLDVVGSGLFSSTLTASNGLTLSTGAISINATSGSVAMTLNSSQNAFAVNSNLFVIDTSNSRIGIGTSSPTSKLQIVGGNCSDDSGGGGCTADYAELYPASEPVEKGDILVADNFFKESFSLNKSRKSYQSGIVGIVSSNPAILIDGGTMQFMNNDYLLNPFRPAVALAGRVPVSISALSKPIQPGDRLTTADEPGKAMKAEKAGPTIGIALEPWNQVDGKDKILTFVNLTWFDSQLTLSDKGDAMIEKNQIDNLYDGVINEPVADDWHNQFKLTIQGTDEIIDRLGFYAGLKAASIEVGIISASKMVTDQVVSRLVKADNLIANAAHITNAKIDSLNAKTIYAEKIAVSSEILSPLIQSDKLVSKTIEAEKTTSETISAREASISGTLSAGNIDSENIRDLQDRLIKVSQDQDRIGTSSSSLSANINDINQRLNELKDSHLVQTPVISLPNSESDTGLFSGQIDPIKGAELADLFVSGQSIFYDTTVLGNFTSGSIAIENNTLLSLTPTLKLTALESIVLFDDAVVITPDGKISTRGELIAQGGVKTSQLNIENEQGLVAGIDASGSARFADITITNKQSTPSAIIAAGSDVAPGQFAIQTNTSSAGNAILPKGESTIFLYNNKITDTSLVYITATSTTENQPLYVSEKRPCDSVSTNQICHPYFSVSIDQPIEEDINFNWWIIR